MSLTCMPALFLGHGSPMNVLDDNDYTRAWRRLGEALPRPQAIVVVSAHWYTRGTGVTAMERPQTLHDFGGFPQALYDTHYPALDRLRWRSVWLNCWLPFPSRSIKKRGDLITALGRIDQDVPECGYPDGAA